MSGDPELALRYERERLQALNRYRVLATPPEDSYDDITQLAASLCETPTALISLIDAERQWFKSRVGFDLPETERDIAFCAVAIEQDGIMEIPDARADERFRDNPLVTGPDKLRFYAGAPLITPDGHRLGTLCVIDQKPRKLTQLQRQMLEVLARQIIVQFELRRKLVEVEDARQALVREQQQRLLAETAQRLSETFMRATLDALADNVAILESSGNIVHVNRAWSKFARDNCPNELIGTTGIGANYVAVCQRAAKSGAQEATEVLTALNTILAGDHQHTFALEYPCHAPSEQRWFSVELSAFGSGSDIHAVIAHRNITVEHQARTKIVNLNSTLESRIEERTADLREAYETIRSSEHELQLRDRMQRRAEQMAGMGSWNWNTRTGEITVSEGLQKIAGIESLSEHRGIEDLLRIIAAPDREEASITIRAVAKDGAPRNLRCEITRPDGEKRLTLSFFDGIPAADGQTESVSGACLDVTELHTTLDRVRRSETQLRALSMRLERIREEERINISREIHDELGQMLTVLKIDLTLLDRDISGDQEIDSQKTQISAALKSMVELVDSTIASVRHIAQQLRPEILDAVGLVAALEWHAEEFQQRTSIQCAVLAKMKQSELSPAIRTTLFRITQEAMTNVARHAKAENIEIKLNQTATQVELNVSDDGIGIDPAGLESSHSLGVLGMRERAVMVAGTFTIRANSDRGTSVIVRLPLSSGDRKKESSR